VTNTSIDLIFDPVEPPLDTSTPRTCRISTTLRKKCHFNRFYGDTYLKARFSTVEDKLFFSYFIHSKGSSLSVFRAFLRLFMFRFIRVFRSILFGMELN
jgi:hypothetical protein